MSYCYSLIVLVLRVPPVFEFPAPVIIHFAHSFPECPTENKFMNTHWPLQLSRVQHMVAQTQSPSVT